MGNIREMEEAKEENGNSRYEKTIIINREQRKDELKMI